MCRGQTHVEGKGSNKENSQEVVTIIQTRSDGDLDQGGCNGDGDKLPNCVWVCGCVCVHVSALQQAGFLEDLNEE